jgi:hypothetical protein
MAIDFMNMFAPRGTPSALDALLSDDQRKLMNRNANLSAAAALLQAGGRSRQRVGLGQALGAALQAGQQGYQQARAGSLQELLLGEKLQESKDERQRNLDYLKLLEGTPAPAPAAPTAMPPMPAPQQGVQVFPLDGSPTSEANQPSLAGLLQQQAIDQAAAPATAPAAAPASANLTGGLNRDMRALLARTPRKEGMQFLLNQAQAAQEFGAPTAVTINGKPVMVQYNKQGQSRVVADAMPYEAQSPDIRAVEYISGRPLAGTGPAGITQVGQYRQQIAPRTNVNVPVDMTGGQKGFENEMKLGSAFKSEPIYKDFNDMKSAFSQVVSSLSEGTPIGDVAGATKIMKLLDPGSVVRESELGIAMAAAGRLDRLQNYFNNLMTGEKLTPTQREDFKSLANELYAAAGQAYNQKRSEYEQFGNAYQFKNLGTALGPAATIPSIVRRPTPTPGGTPRQRRDLNDIFGVR